MRLVLVGFVLGLGLVTAISWEEGTPCNLQHSLTPTLEFGDSQALDDVLPFKVEITNKYGHKVWFYMPGDIYTIRITSSQHFRAFALQMRLATKDRHVIGHLRAGEFYPDETWKAQGIKIQNCPPVFNNSVTNTDFTKKFAVEVKWRVFRNFGPLQLFATIMHEQAVYWARWSPKAGFLLPAESMGKPSHSGEESGPKNQPPPPRTEAPWTITDALVPELPDEDSFEGSGEGGDEQQPTPSLHLLPPPERSDIEKPSGTKPEIVDTFVVQPLPQEKINPRPTAESTAPAPWFHQTQPPFQPFPQPLETQPPFQPEPVQHETFAPRPVHNTQPPVPQPQPFGGNPPPHGSHIESPIETQPWQPEYDTTTTDPVDDGQIIDHSQFDPRTGRITSYKVKVIDQCQYLPCANNGTCNNLPEEASYYCDCSPGYTGENCEEQNHCVRHKCKNGAICKNGETSYTCECRGEWAGERCDRSCPAYLCDNGGKCIIDSRTNDYGCDCKKGWTGKRCDKEANECLSRPCKNGGKCVDKFASFKCECRAGWMGDTCHRPCQNIYKSCKRWDRESRCEVMRPLTKFFDINCASTCGQCVFRNETVRTDKPIPPIMEPFAFLVGRWIANSEQSAHWPSDFSSKTKGYEAIWEFTVPVVPMFGTPSLNFSSRATSKNDPSDQHRTFGFFTLNARHQKGRPYTVALMSTSNNGVAMVEEGRMEGRQIDFKVKHQKSHPYNEFHELDILESERTIVLSGLSLQETVQKKLKDGTKAFYTNIYRKEDRFSTF